MPVAGAMVIPDGVPEAGRIGTASVNFLLNQFDTNTHCSDSGFGRPIFSAAFVDRSSTMV